MEQRTFDNLILFMDRCLATDITDLMRWDATDPRAGIAQGLGDRRIHMTEDPGPTGPTLLRSRHREQAPIFETKLQALRDHLRNDHETWKTRTDEMLSIYSRTKDTSLIEEFCRDPIPALMVSMVWSLISVCGTEDMPRVRAAFRILGPQIIAIYSSEQKFRSMERQLEAALALFGNPTTTDL